VRRRVETKIVIGGISSLNNPGNRDKVGPSVTSGSALP